MSKFMQYNSTSGAPSAFYTVDIHGDNIPSGCIEISDDIWQEVVCNPGKYVVDLTKLPVNGEIDTLTDLFKLYVPTLQEAQAAKLSQIHITYGQALAGGFSTSASGAAVTFAYDTNAQLKFMQLMLAVNGNMITYPAPLPAIDGTIVTYTQAQLQQVFQDLSTFGWSMQNKLHNLLNEVNTATTTDAVNAISW